MQKILNNFWKKIKDTFVKKLKKETFTLKNLAQDGHTYWKFSQTVPGRSAEEYYAEYKEGEKIVATDKEIGLSFVSDSIIAKYYMYGDQLTKICMDINNSSFAEIQDYRVYKSRHIGGVYEARILLVEENHSLKEKETIRLLVSMIPDDKNLLWTGWFNEKITIYPSFEEHLKKLGFKESAELIGQLHILAKNNIGYSKNEALEFIKTYKDF